MNRTQPTPGPWMIQRNADKTPRLDCDRRLTIIDRRSFFIATVHADADEHEEVDREEQLANAAFIVRAVNTHAHLLEALKALVSMERTQGVDDDTVDRIMEQAEAAIAAAEGKE